MIPNPVSPRYEIVAYFPEWGPRQLYYVKSIEQSGSADKVTLINYAFGVPGPDPQTGDVVCLIEDAQAAYGQVYSAEVSIDGQADDPLQPLRGHFNQLRKLKAKYPHIKVVMSLGGWTGSGWFSDAARTAETRQKFVASCIDLYIRGNLPQLQNGAGGVGVGAGVFDGIDLDWEYPIRDGLPENHYHPEDGANFVLLLQEFRRQYVELGRPDLLLTMAAPGPAQAVLYNLNEGHPYLDMISLMTYDLVNGYSQTTGHHTCLCTPADTPSQLSADQTVRIYRDSLGIPAHKLMLGAAFYGRAWRNVPPENHGLYQPGDPGGVEGFNYRDLVHHIGQDYPRYWDAQAKAPWLYNPAERIFWTYDDPETLRLKAQYVRHFGLGGVMFWEISADEPQGMLVDALYRELSSSEPAPDPCN